MEKLTRIYGNIIATFFATTGGVTLSEVSRRQAEHKQHNDTYWGLVRDAVNSIFTRVITFVGGGRSSEELAGIKITASQLHEYAGVARRNAEISTLMHAVKLYKRIEQELMRRDLRLFVVDSLPEAPSMPTAAQSGALCGTEKFMELSNIDEMIAALNPTVLGQFDFAFFKKANELNSRAAVLGKLLSEQGSLFRELVRPLPLGADQATQNGVILTRWRRLYTPEELAEFAQLREQYQAEYNALQRQLNGCRKQLKDAVRAYNLEEECRYQREYGVFRVAAEKYSLEMEQIRSAAETLRQQAGQELATLRCRVE